MPRKPGQTIARLVVLAIALGALASSTHAQEPVSGLTAENLVLIVNKREPAGLRLATFYAQQRHVPADRIIALDLPNADELSNEEYNANIVPPVRAFLTDNKLTDKVTCLVTFFGVPLRVGPRSNTPQETAEYREIDQASRQALATITQAVSGVEDLARQAKSGFAKGAGDDPAHLSVRAATAIEATLEGLAADTDANRRGQRFIGLMGSVETLFGPLEATERMTLPAYANLANKPVPPEREAEVKQRAIALVKEMQELSRAEGDPAARKKIRALFADNLGALRLFQVLTEQKFRLETAETEAAVDNELACLWWPDERIRYRWHENPLYYRIRLASALRGEGGGGPAAPAVLLPHTMMVMRIDAPTEQLAHDLIETSIHIEQTGLKGIVALDARGKPPPEPYGRFDETLRSLAADLRSKVATTVVLDDREAVFQPGSVKDAALYCGWYSLRHYVPGVSFVPGAVGYHVASSELISLHHPRETGWVHGLMSDGVVATLGPVAEPYLHSFPLPSEFFPLLMTGKLTMAEVYWQTNPMVSWMQAFIGDPLYTPYASNPLLKAEDVSPQLRVIFTRPPIGSPATRPASPPAP